MKNLSPLRLITIKAIYFPFFSQCTPYSSTKVKNFFSLAHYKVNPEINFKQLIWIYICLKPLDTRGCFFIAYQRNIFDLSQSMKWYFKKVLQSNSLTTKVTAFSRDYFIF